MICQKCKEEDKESIIYKKDSLITLMNTHTYYDKLGLYHSHNPNKLKTAYECSNGHWFYTVEYIECPNCDHRKDEKEIKYIN